VPRGGVSGDTASVHDVGSTLTCDIRRDRALLGNVDSLSDEEAKLAREYFDGFAGDYQRAFTGRGVDPLHAVINRLFRRKTFQRRTAVVMDYLAELGLTGKTVLDVGCGSGDVSIEAARAGAACVIGVDIAPGMVALATRAAAAAGLSDRVVFHTRNIFEAPPPPCDVALLIGVIEYYGNLDALFGRIAPHVADAIIIADTRGPWWRRTLRRGLARWKHFHLYYRPPEQVSAAVGQFGFLEDQRHVGHSFTVTRHRRRRAGA
jgi:SAM-dependent methyltransferase